jgi:hypothetical protein
VTSVRRDEPTELDIISELAVALVSFGKGFIHQTRTEYTTIRYFGCTEHGALYL